jgi:hypothetical protein
LKKEFFKTAILNILVFLSLILTFNIWFDKELWPQGYSSFVYSLENIFPFLSDDIYIETLKEQGFLNPEISYDLSYSQGSGASFTCTELDYDILLKEYTGKHKNWLISILKHYGEIKIERCYSCHYVHENSCNTELYEYTQYNYSRIIDELENIRKYIEYKRLEACSTLYDQLEAEINWLTSDECIKEILIANDYYFNPETLTIEY